MAEANKIAAQLRDLMDHARESILGSRENNLAGPEAAEAEALMVCAVLEGLAQRLDAGASPPNLSMTYISATSTLNAVFISLLTAGTQGPVGTEEVFKLLATEGLLADIARLTREKLALPLE